jgi:hypothetical protein
MDSMPSGDGEDGSSASNPVRCALVRRFSPGTSSATAYDEVVGFMLLDLVEHALETVEAALQGGARGRDMNWP